MNIIRRMLLYIDKCMIIVKECIVSPNTTSYICISGDKTVIRRVKE